MLDLIQMTYEALGIAKSVNYGDLFGVLSVLSLVLAGSFQFFQGPENTKGISKNKEDLDLKDISREIDSKLNKTDSEKDSTIITWKERLKKGLSRSRSEVWGRIGSLFTGEGLTPEQLEEIEELLYSADIGPSVATELTEALKERVKSFFLSF